MSLFFGEWPVVASRLPALVLLYIVVLPVALEPGTKSYINILSNIFSIKFLWCTESDILICSKFWIIVSIRNLVNSKIACLWNYLDYSYVINGPLYVCDNKVSMITWSVLNKWKSWTLCTILCIVITKVDLSNNVRLENFIQQLHNTSRQLSLVT